VEKTGPTVDEPLSTVTEPAAGKIRPPEWEEIA
jgi:hypothetical protein